MYLADTINSIVLQVGPTLFEKLSEKFFLRSLFDFAAVFVLIRFIYYPNHRNREHFFTFFMFNLIIFLITFLLNKVDFSLGAAFGLFAVFTMLRYRTEGINMTDMTYLFTVIAMGLINAVSKGGWDELLLINLLILAATFLLDSTLFFRREVSKTIIYDNLDMLHPDKHPELIRQLGEKMGLNIHRIVVDKVNLLNESACITVFYYEK